MKRTVKVPLDIDVYSLYSRMASEMGVPVPVLLAQVLMESMAEVVSDPGNDHSDEMLAHPESVCGFISPTGQVGIFTAEQIEEMIRQAERA